MYGVLPYFISRNIIDIPYLIVIPLFFQLIIYWMIGMGNTPEQFFFMYFALFLHFFTATSLGLFVGSMITDAKTVSAILNMVFQPFIVFSGLYKNNHSYADWIGWLRFLSPFNYCFTALIEN
jgi:ABC-type multidrug transport system permease subunit